MADLAISNQRGPLRVSAENGRYLVDHSGRPVFLSGFHTWASVQDGGPTDPPAAFDWDAYLAACVSAGCNFVKLWSCETARSWSDVEDIWFFPCYYERTGPGNAADGGLKFDLTQVNRTWLQRLYDRAVDCQQRGIYVCVQFFDGWNIETKGWAGDPFAYHWYNSANNINSIDGDQDNDGEGTETHYNNASNVVIDYQEALIEAVIDKLNDLDNIFWEISNEDTGSAQDNSWHNRLIDHIHTYEASKPKQHPVMFSWQYPSGDNANLDASNAEIFSYGANDAAPITSPQTPNSSQCNMFDTDHNGGLVYSFEWIWRCLCRGNGGAWYMDEWDGVSYLGVDRRNDASCILIRNNLGYALTLVELLKNMLLMTSQAALCTTGWCLARNHATQAEYICFQDGTGAFDLNLSTATGTLNIRWLRCSNGTIDTGSTVSGGATRTLTPPWAGAVVAYVYHS